MTLKKITTKVWVKISFLTLYICLLISQNVISQDAPYYQSPQNRKQNHELVVMPNLNTFTTTYFIAASVGIKKSILGEMSGSPAISKTTSESTGMWEITFGQNRNDNWIFEIGLAQYNSNIKTNFSELSRYPIIFTNEAKQLYAPLRVKKKILTLNKISRAAFINVGVGVNYLIKNQKTSNEVGQYKFFQRPIPEANDYKTLEFALSTSNQPLVLEFLTEIRGKVSERLELAVFGKAFVRNNKYLKNKFVFNYVDGSSRGFEAYEKPISISFGIQAKFNSPRYYSYKSKVD